MTYKNSIEFKINEVAKIVINLGQASSEMSCFCEIPIILELNNQKFILSMDYLYENMIELQSSLHLALQNKLPLHPSIQKNIGILNNEYMTYWLKDIDIMHPDLMYIQDSDGFQDWVGKKNMIWSYNLTTTWIYNLDTNIIFEVTPMYPKIYSDPLDKPNQISYKNWLKNYKPIISIILPKATVEEWLQAATSIINRIDVKTK